MNGRPFGESGKPTNGSTAGWLNCLKALMEGITFDKLDLFNVNKIKPNAGKLRRTL
jgi:hypothetical protein